MAEQILTEISGTETSLSLFLDGVNFVDYGVYVSKHSGIIDGLSMKEPQKRDWKDEHGEFIDLETPRYNFREIEFDCFMRGGGKLEFYSKLQTFLKAIQKPNLRNLTLNIASKPLVYMVYQADKIDIDKQWRSSDMIGEFKIKLIEPQPIKRLLKFVATTGATVSLTMTSSNPINIYWGDGASLLDVYGTAQTKTHQYSVAGTYYILITGVIEEVSNFTTTAEIVWSKY